jgi:hypothetical protein
MKLNEIKKSAKEYGLTITTTTTAYVISKNGRELTRVAKSAGLAKLTDALANCAS